MQTQIPTTVDVQAIITRHPRVSRRLKEIPDELKHYQKLEKSVDERAEAEGRFVRAQDSYFGTIQGLKCERDRLLTGAPLWDESQVAYLQRCASIFIEAMYQLDQSGDTDSANYRRFHRYWESINAQLSAPNVSVDVRQTVNIMMAMGVSV